jgi:hypothetical protein
MPLDLFALDKTEKSFELPRAEAPYLQPRKAPVFDAESSSLAATWGPSIPFGVEYHLEKSYGRWVFGKPLPLPKMKPADRPGNAWVYNRMLVPPGDSSTRSPEALRRIFLAEHHTAAALRTLGINGGKGKHLYLSFLNNLVLSENTLAAFIRLDEAPAVGWKIQDLLLAPAEAASKLGFLGANLNFLKDEAAAKRRERARMDAERAAKILKPPTIEPPGAEAKEFALGRYISEKNFDLPPLTNEEVDGHLYLRAIAVRTLRGCADDIQNYWKNRPFNVYRVKNYFGRPASDRLWFQIQMPGGNFFHSDSVLSSVQNEAELAFLVVRPFLLSLRQDSAEMSFPDDWVKAIPRLAPETLLRLRAQQSAKMNAKIDVAADISIDLAALKCVAEAGYRFDAGLGYLKRIRAASKLDWSSGFIEHAPGLDYRIERVEKELAEAVALGKIKRSLITNPARLEAAQKLWNI